MVPILLTLIDETKDQPEANESRYFAAESIERLTGEINVLTTIACRCLVDCFWQCRMRGLFVVERQPELRDSFVPIIELLVKDEVEEIRDLAREIVDGFAKGE